MSDIYLSEAFSSLYSKDGLVVMAGGLGLKHLFVKFLQYYCEESKLAPTEALNRKGIIFCINLLDVSGSSRGYDDISSYSSDNICSALLAEGLMPYELPRIITNEVSSQERVDMYTTALQGQTGQVFLITSRILIVDMLDNRINPLNIKGFLVPNAHRINEYSIEAFILRVYREYNTHGFIKAFSEDPESLSSSSQGSPRILQCLKLLFLRALYLYPRSHPKVVEAITPTTSSYLQPDVVEMSIALTNSMKAIQSAILAAIRVCVSELKRSTNTSGILDDILTLENGHLFTAGLDRTIRKLLDPEWHKISYRTKALLSDLADLRKLLDYLLRYDAFSFYYFLLKLKQASMDNSNSKSNSTPAFWLTSDAADQIFTKAKERVYRILTRAQYQKLLHNQSISKSLDLTQPTTTTSSRPEVLLPPEALQIDNILYPILEVPPKWKILKQIITEIKDDMKSKKDSIKSSNKDTSWIKKQKVLIFVRDELTLSQLQDFLTYEETYVMDQRYRWFISQQVAEIKQVVTSNSTSQQKKKQRVHNHSSSSSILPPVPIPIGSIHEDSSNRSMVDNSLPRTKDPNSDDVYSSSNNNVNLNVAIRHEDTNFWGLHITKREWESLSNENKLLILEEQKLHGRLLEPSSVENMLSTTNGSEFISESLQKERSTLNANIENDIMSNSMAVEGIYDEDDENNDSDNNDDNNYDQDESDSMPASTSNTNKQKRKFSTVHVNANSSKISSNSNSNSASSTAHYSSSYHGTTRKKTEQNIKLSFKKSKTVIGNSMTNSHMKDEYGEIFEGQPFDWIDNRIQSEERIEIGSIDSSNSIESTRTARSEHMVILMTHNEAIHMYYNVMEELIPDYIIMYDGDINLIRIIETYQASKYKKELLISPKATLSPPIKVYYTYYDESAEKHRYADALSREKKGFLTLSSLVDSGMVSSIALPDSMIQLAAAKAEDKEIIRDSRHLQREMDFSNAIIPVSSSSSSTSSKRVNNPIRMMNTSTSTLNSGNMETLPKVMGKPIVVIDVREFRSPLPSLLHAAGFTIVPRTLAVGDYVLAAEIVVERKGISDLFQSFASGRLYNQVESMSRYYKYPCLLIEFTADKSFALQTISDITSDIQSHHITSRISILTLTFPNLRILWSRSPHETGNIFLSLVQGHEPVDIIKAINAGSLNPLDPASLSSSSSTSVALSAQGDIFTSEAKLTAQEILLSLPGVNVHNFRMVMNSIKNLHELSRIEEKDLIPLIGPANAKKLSIFFRQRLAIV